VQVVETHAFARSSSPGAPDRRSSRRTTQPARAVRVVAEAYSVVTPPDRRSPTPPRWQPDRKPAPSRSHCSTPARRPSSPRLPDRRRPSPASALCREPAPGTGDRSVTAPPREHRRRPPSTPARRRRVSTGRPSVRSYPFHAARSAGEAPSPFLAAWALPRLGRRRTGPPRDPKRHALSSLAALRFLARGSARADRHYASRRRTRGHHFRGSELNGRNGRGPGHSWRDPGAMAVGAIGVKVVASRRRRPTSSTRRTRRRTGTPTSRGCQVHAGTPLDETRCGSRSSGR